MASIRKESIISSLNKVVISTDFKIYNDITERYDFQKQKILDDNSLTVVEQAEAIKLLTVYYDYQKVLYSKGTKRLCKECQKDCFATLYCEHCVRTYLKNNFSIWTSGNNDIDNLIQKCQMESLCPDQIIDWIPYHNLQDIEFITKGNCSEIYSANWVDGRYCVWDPKEKQLKRFGTHKVILKKLKNVKNANKNWFDEVKLHLTISNKYSGIVRSYGFTQEPSSGDYMLVMHAMDMDLRRYLQHKCTWKEGINAAYDIIEALYRIRYNKTVHRNLHSGNILYSQEKNSWYISDFGFCGPADKPLRNIYGNLPYIAPEAIIGKEYTFASDVYSFGILMWEISSGQIPFNDYDHDYDLAMKIVNGMRPKITSNIPLGYEKLMKQCWDADPLKRPDARTLLYKIKKMRRDSYSDSDSTDESDVLTSSSQAFETNFSTSSISGLYKFENLPEPRNATEAFHTFPVDDNKYNSVYFEERDNLGIPEDETFHSKQQNNLEIPKVIENLTKSNTIEEKQDNLETPEVIDNFNEINNKGENLMKSFVTREIDKSNNQFEKTEYNEKNNSNLENQDCSNTFKDEVKQKTRSLKKRFNIIKQIKKLPKLIKKGSSH